FPAVPSDWKDVTIHRMRTEGAFLVSAVRRGGKTQFISIESLAGEPCRIATDMENPKSDGPALKKLADNYYELTLTKGQSALLTPPGPTPDLTIEPVKIESPTNPWGLP